MEFVDDRSDAQKHTHTSVIRGMDSFLSGWGKAAGGCSIAAWACKPEHEQKVFAWVKSRGDMKKVMKVVSTYHPSGTGHCHIYVVGDNHPALK